MKKWLIILVNVIIILIVICNYQTNKTVVNPSKMTLPENAENIDFVNVNITYDESLGTEPLSEVEAAIQLMPADVIRQFVADKWKIAVVTEIDLTGTEYEGDNSTEYVTVGLTNYETKTIQIRPVEQFDNSTKLKALHELCHYADVYYGNASNNKMFIDLYETYRNSYVEYEFSNVAITKANKKDIHYATSDKYEFFACLMKDYINNPEYLRQNYSELYTYEQKLQEGKNE